MEVAVLICDDEDEKQDIRDGKTKEGRWLKNILSIKMKLLQGNYVNGLMKNVRDLFYKKEIMESLLESIQTDKLRASFDKYLPAVINGDGSGIKRKPIESVKKEVTGNREVLTEEVRANGHFPGTENVVDIKRLAGL